MYKLDEIDTDRHTKLRVFNESNWILMKWNEGCQIYPSHVM